MFAWSEVSSMIVCPPGGSVNSPSAEADSRDAPAVVSTSKRALERSAARPKALPVNPAGIPAELKEREQWVAWTYFWDKAEGRWTKLPINPRTGKAAKADDPSTWGTFVEALTRYQSQTGRLDGIGYQFSSEDPFCGVDVDDCRDRDTGAVAEWGGQIIARLGSYSEISPSQTGVKVLVRAHKPGDRCRKEYKTGKVEIYEQERFFALTGHHLDGTPTTVNDRQAQLEEVYFAVFGQPRTEGTQDGEDPATLFLEALEHPPATVSPPSTASSPLTDEDLIRRATAAKNGDRFRRLWEGETTGYDTPSEADQAFCDILAFWTGKDSVQMDRVFRTSALMRPKWDEKRGKTTYGERTIAKALRRVQEVYDGSGGNSQEGGEPRERSSGARPNQPASFTLGPLTLRLEKPRRSESGKVSVSVGVFRGERRVDQIALSSAASAREKTVQTLKRLADANAEPVVGSILAEAAALADLPPAPPQGPTVASIIAEKVPPRFELVFRTTRGAFSEKRGEEWTAADFSKFVPRWLRVACERAVDAPANRLTLFRQMQAELGSLWATLVENLPTEDQANVGPGSPAAKRFKGKLIEALTDTVTFEVSRTTTGTSGEAVSARSSLVERIRSQAEPYLLGKVSPGPREPWHPAQRAFDCWWRPIKVRGKTTILIGLRYRIGFQVKKNLPGVFDQESFRLQCERSGVLASNVRVRDRLTDGSRLVILSQHFIRELLALPREPRNPPREGPQDGSG
jgi:hypothetical protein